MGLESTQKLPRLVCHLSLVARFCVEEQRTYWEVHCYINKLIDEEAIDKDGGKFLKIWLRANCQGDMEDPKLHLALNSAINGARDFTKWCFDHLNTFLGRERGTVTPYLSPGQSGVDIGTVLRDMSMNLKGLNQRKESVAVDSSGGKTKDTVIKPYSVYDSSVLMV